MKQLSAATIDSLAQSRLSGNTKELEMKLRWIYGRRQDAKDRHVAGRVKIKAAAPGNNPRGHSQRGSAATCPHNCNAVPFTKVDIFQYIEIFFVLMMIWCELVSVMNLCYRRSSSQHCQPRH